MMKTKDSIFASDSYSKSTKASEFLGFWAGGNKKEQSSGSKLNSLRRNRLRKNDIYSGYSLVKSEKYGSKTKYAFIVDWQMSDTL